MYKLLLFLCLISLFTTCLGSDNANEKSHIPKMDIIQAQRLSNLPIHCVTTQYPNKMGQTLGSSEDQSHLVSPEFGRGTLCGRG